MGPWLRLFDKTKGRGSTQRPLSPETARSHSRAGHKVHSIFSSCCGVSGLICPACLVVGSSDDQLDYCWSIGWVSAHPAGISVARLDSSASATQQRSEASLASAQAQRQPDCGL